MCRVNVQFEVFLIKKKNSTQVITAINLTSKCSVILTEFPAFTTMKLFILWFMNFGLTTMTKQEPKIALE